MKENLASFKALYIETARVYVQHISESLSILRTNSHDTYAISNAYISAHSLSSQSAVMGFAQMQAVCRLLEKIFHGLREKEVPADDAMLTVLENATARLNKDIDRIEKDTTEDDLSETSALLSGIKTDVSS